MTSRASGVQAIAYLQLMLMDKSGKVLFNRPSMEIRERDEISVDAATYFDESGPAPMLQAQLAVLRAHGMAPLLWPRNAGSYPGFAFTDPPLSLASGHFGMGHGSGAHAPDEYYVIDSANKNLGGIDDAAMSFAEYFYELAK